MTESKTIGPAAPCGILQLEDKGIEKSIAKLLKKGIDPDFICEYMDVSPKYAEQIRKSYFSE